MKLLRSLASNETLLPLLTTKSGAFLIDTFSNFAQQATRLSEITLKASMDDKGDDLLLAQEVMESFKHVEESLKKSASLSPSGQNVACEYESLLRGRLYDFSPILTQFKPQFQLATHVEQDSLLHGYQGHKITRLAHEHSSLATSLPFSRESSIFLRVDAERIDVLKALIIGPTDTPYSSGCFEFDIFCPWNYPEKPPHVLLLTTGNGKVRFNPNLYSCGKVCLSLLNTWEGENQWDSRTSTLLQVLISIQSLVLVPQPFFNEPGYEKMNGLTSAWKSRNYNDEIRIATIRHAIIGPITTPNPSCFSDIIKTHFFLRKDEIIQQCEGWLKDMEGRKDANPNYWVLQQVVEDLKVVMSKLQMPPPAE
jgi:baculoviral IAP repeat-containing protein 6